MSNSQANQASEAIDSSVISQQRYRANKARRNAFIAKKKAAAVPVEEINAVETEASPIGVPAISDSTIVAEAIDIEDELEEVEEPASESSGNPPSLVAPKARVVSRKHTTIEGVIFDYFEFPMAEATKYTRNRRYILNLDGFDLNSTTAYEDTEALETTAPVFFKRTKVEEKDGKTIWHEDYDVSDYNDDDFYIEDFEQVTDYEDYKFIGNLYKALPVDTRVKLTGFWYQQCEKRFYYNRKSGLSAWNWEWVWIFEFEDYDIVLPQTHHVNRYTEAIVATPALSKRIRQRYFDSDITIIKQDPYFGVRHEPNGFTRYDDRIKSVFRLKANHHSRMDAAILAILNEAKSASPEVTDDTVTGTTSNIFRNGYEKHDGHSYLAVTELLEDAQVLVRSGIPAAALQTLLEDSLERLRIKDEVVIEDDRVYLAEMHEAETKLAFDIVRLMTESSREFPTIEEVQEWIEKFEEAHKETFPTGLEAHQREAVVRAMTTPLTITNGKAGTGKTTAAGVVIHCCKAEKGVTIGIASTGKAARNFESRTGLPALTMHKFCSRPKKYLRPGIEKKLTLFVDEVGMSDLITARRFFAILPTGVRVILYGDVNQLPSVEAGRVLADLIESKVVPVTTLEVVKRQGSDSQIVPIANAVLEGNSTIKIQNFGSYQQAALVDDVFDDLFGDILPAQDSDTDNLDNIDDLDAGALIEALLQPFVSTTPDKPADVQFVRELYQTEIETKILELVQSDLTELTGVWLGEGENKRRIERDDVQVLSLQKSNYAGTDRLNALLQAAHHGEPAPELNVNPKERQLTSVMVGDRVIIIQNDYKRDVANGDTGTVISTSEDRNSFQIEIPGDGKNRKTKIVEYRASEINNHVKLAYALTVHKSQGSEYPVVIIPVSKTHLRMLNQNMLYTAITRGKKLVLLVGSTNALRGAITTPAPRRNSTVSSRIRSAYKLALRRFTRA